MTYNWTSMPSWGGYFLKKTKLRWILRNFKSDWMAPSCIVQNFIQKPIFDHNIDKRKGCTPTINVGVIRWEVVGRWLKLGRTWWRRCIGCLTLQLSLSAKEPWMRFLFYWKWSIKTRHPMHLHQCITMKGMQHPHVILKPKFREFPKISEGVWKPPEWKFPRTFWFFVFVSGAVFFWFC